MAKASTRVHLLAKELNVKSKAIIEKCQAEGLDQIKNHMSTISVGLAATIREWFSEGEHSTTVETASRVDLKKVRIKKKKTTKKEPPEVKEVQPPEVAVAEEVSVQPAAEALEQPAEAVVEETPPTEPVEKKVKAPKAKKKVKKAKKPEKPKEPEIIVPAGPMLEKPKPASLSGPTHSRFLSSSVRPSTASISIAS